MSFTVPVISHSYANNEPSKTTEAAMNSMEGVIADAVVVVEECECNAAEGEEGDESNSRLVLVLLLLVVVVVVFWLKM